MFKAIYKFFHKHYHLRYHGVYRHAKKLFVFDMALLAFALFLLGTSIFFFFWKPTIVDLVDLSFSFGNDRIRSGDEIRIGLNYRNRSEHNLKDALIGVHLPPGFVVNRSKTPETIFTKNSILNIGDIESGGSGMVDIYGFIFAEPNKDERITGYFSYIREDTGKKEQKVAASIFKAAGSVLMAELTLPTSSFSSREVPVNLKLTNFGTSVLESIAVKHDSPKPFLPETQTKSIVLQPGESRVLSGIIVAPQQGGKYLQNFEVGLLVNNVYIKQIQISRELDVYSPEVTSEAKIESNIPYAEGGQTIPLKLKWKNNSQATLSNLKLRLFTTPGIVDLKATAIANNMKVDGQNIVADKNTRTSMADGRPGNSDEFEIKLVLLNRFTTDGQTTLQIKPTMEGEIPDLPGQKFYREGSPTSLPVSTQIFLNLRPIYYTADGDQLGRGPLPPQIGETTKYWIAATIDNGVNPVSQNSFRATLGDGIEFTGKQSVTIGPEINYDPESKVVTWNYYLVPAMSEIGLYFEVAVTPSASQVGKKIVLIKNSAFSAADDLLGKNLSDSTGILDNTLRSDDRGRFSGAEVTE